MYEKVGENAYTKLKSTLNVGTVSVTLLSSDSALTVQSHRHLGKHRPVGGVFRYLLLPVAPHSSGSRHVRRGKHMHASMCSYTCLLMYILSLSHSNNFLWY